MSFTARFKFYLRFVNYWLSAVDGHSLHPPFIYRFYHEVIQSAQRLCFTDIEQLRKTFLKDQRLINVNDPGAGSTYTSKNLRSVASIAKTSLSHRELSQLLYCIAEHYQARYAIELGTSLGITTQYLAKPENIVVHTIEGVPEILEIAQSHLEDHSRVVTHQGGIDEALNEVLEAVPHVDLAYLDANHTLEATLNYYAAISEKKLPSTIIVIGDIHWSEGMEKAWEMLKMKDEVSLSVDLFHCGLLFFLPQREKQDYVIWF